MRLICFFVTLFSSLCALASTPVHLITLPTEDTPAASGETPSKVSSVQPKKLRSHPNTVFGDDDRHQLFDFTYPWSPVGRMAPIGCTATLVGPRHALTATHCLNWADDKTLGWMGFEAAFDRYDRPFGTANVTAVYMLRDFHYKNSYHSNWDGFDMAVLVLDQEVGIQAGWMGTMTYDSSWDGQSLWTNVGYPDDLGNNLVPYYQQNCSVSKVSRKKWGRARSWQLSSKCDTAPGQSGGPLFGFFDDKPYIVAVVNTQDRKSNYFSGGSTLPRLVSQVLKESGYGRYASPNDGEPTAPSAPFASLGVAR